MIKQDNVEDETVMTRSLVRKGSASLSKCIRQPESMASDLIVIPALPIMYPDA